MNKEPRSLSSIDRDIARHYARIAQIVSEPSADEETELKAHAHDLKLLQLEKTLAGYHTGIP